MPESEVDSAETKVLLVRMEGKLDLINERHTTTTDNIKALQDRVQGHSGRLNSLETDRHVRAGQMQAVSAGAKLVYLAGGGTFVGVMALLARALHV